MVKPILVVVLHFVDAEYELCESFEEEDSEEKEKEKAEDSKEKEHKLYCPEYVDLEHSQQVMVLDVRSSKYTDDYHCIRVFNLDVPIPPPKNC